MDEIFLQSGVEEDGRLQCWRKKPLISFEGRDGGDMV